MKEHPAFTQHKPECLSCRAGEICSVGLTLARSGFPFVEGMYILTEDVPNPGADRRSKDWDKASTFPKGSRYHLEENVELKGLFGIRKLGKYGFLYPKSKAFEALALHLQPIAATPRELLQIHSIYCEGALAQLLEDGVVTFDQVKAAHEAFYKEE